MQTKEVVYLLKNAQEKKLFVTITMKSGHKFPSNLTVEGEVKSYQSDTTVAIVLSYHERDTKRFIHIDPAEIAAIDCEEALSNYLSVFSSI